jgi:formylmethanofuran--tetrahydromethanopterin N-formyltransferase
MIQGVDQAAALSAARRAVAAIEPLPGVMTPFPGGVVRSGSKVGSKYAALKASTNHGFCPTLRGQVATEMVAGAGCVYEIVIDGVDEAAVSLAMRVGIEAAVGAGIPAISAGNYGGKLGKFHFHLHPVLGLRGAAAGPG